MAIDYPKTNFQARNINQTKREFYSSPMFSSYTTLQKSYTSFVVNRTTSITKLCHTRLVLCCKLPRAIFQVCKNPVLMLNVKFSSLMTDF